MKTVRLLDVGKDVLMDAIVSAYLEAHPNVRVDQMYVPQGEPDEITYIKDKIDRGEVDIVPVVGLDTMIRQKLELALDPHICGRRLRTRHCRASSLFDIPWSTASVRTDDTWLKLTRLLRTAVDQMLSGQRTYDQAAADYAVGYEQIMAQR